MPLDLLLSLLALTIAGAWTPGPNTSMVAASGANFGLRRTMPHVMGICIGFPVMVLVVGLALGEVFAASPALRSALRWGGAAVLLWLALQIARAGGLGRPDAPRPFSFLQAAAFQWVNPKAWVLAVAVTTQFIHPDRPLVTALIVAAAFAVAGLTGSLAWAGLGQALRGWLSVPGRLRAFNVTMGGLIALSVVGMLWQGA
ncbi:MAG: LysE family translocator [Alkalilacustris sp.]